MYLSVYLFIFNRHNNKIHRPSTAAIGELDLLALQMVEAEVEELLIETNASIRNLNQKHIATSSTRESKVWPWCCATIFLAVDLVAIYVSTHACIVILEMNGKIGHISLYINTHTLSVSLSLPLFIYLYHLFDSTGSYRQSISGANTACIWSFVDLAVYSQSSGTRKRHRARQE